MSFDYTDKWSSVADHHANLYNSYFDLSSSSFDTDTAVQHYMTADIDSFKINMSISLYGRAFCNISESDFAFDGVGSDQWEIETWNYKMLSQSDANEYHDDIVEVWYSYDSKNKIMIFYDSVMTAQAKSDYIKWMRLDEAMYWESSDDKSENQSIIRTVRANISRIWSAANDELDFWFSCCETLSQSSQLYHIKVR